MLTMQNILKAMPCKVRLDNGFTCKEAGWATVHQDLAIPDPLHGLYVTCNEGRHYLDGQQDETGNLVGVLEVEKL